MQRYVIGRFRSKDAELNSNWTYEIFTSG